MDEKTEIAKILKEVQNARDNLNNISKSLKKIGGVKQYHNYDTDT